MCRVNAIKVWLLSVLWLSLGFAQTLYGVTGVAHDDFLNVRVGPGVSNAIISTLLPDATGIQKTGSEERIGQSNWVSIIFVANDQIIEGWVNDRYLKALTADEVFSPIDEELRAINERVINHLRAGHYRLIAEEIHPQKPLVVSHDGHFSHDDPRFTAEDLVLYLQTHQPLLWGYEDGTGKAITLNATA